jgi:Cupin domain
MKRRMYFLTAAAAAVALLSPGAFVAITMASPPSGVTPTLLARGTYEAFKVKSGPLGPIEFEAEAKPAVDIVVRRHDYVPGSTTGWHSHPGPVFITVTQGQLRYYDYDDPNCTPHVVSAGHGFVDDGRGHIVRNETGQPAQDVSVITAPVGSAFRGELTAPGPHCDF